MFVGVPSAYSKDSKRRRSHIFTSQLINFEISPLLNVFLGVHFELVHFLLGSEAGFEA